MIIATAVSQSTIKTSISKLLTSDVLGGLLEDFLKRIDELLIAAGYVSLLFETIFFGDALSARRASRLSSLLTLYITITKISGKETSTSTSVKERA